MASHGCLMNILGSIVSMIYKGQCTINQHLFQYIINVFKSSHLLQIGLNIFIYSKAYDRYISPIPDMDHSLANKYTSVSPINLQCEPPKNMLFDIHINDLLCQVIGDRTNKTPILVCWSTYVQSHTVIEQHGQHA